MRQTHHAITHLNYVRACSMLAEKSTYPAAGELEDWLESEEGNPEVFDVLSLD